MATLREKLKKKLMREPYRDELESVKASKRAKAVEADEWRAKSITAFCLQQDGAGEENANEEQWKRYFDQRHMSLKDFEADDEEPDDSVKAAAWKAVNKLLRKDANAEFDWSKQIVIHTYEVDAGDGGADPREVDTKATMYSPFAMTRAVSLHMHRSVRASSGSLHILSLLKAS